MLRDKAPKYGKRIEGVSKKHFFCASAHFKNSAWVTKNNIYSKPWFYQLQAGQYDSYQIKSMSLAIIHIALKNSTNRRCGHNNLTRGKLFYISSDCLLILIPDRPVGVFTDTFQCLWCVRSARTALRAESCWSNVKTQSPWIGIVGHEGQNKWCGGKVKNPLTAWGPSVNSSWPGFTQRRIQ